MEQSTYVKSLDGLRFVAVTLVLLDHWTNYRLGFQASYLGVSIFFVLSGYLITGILLKAKAADNQLYRPHGRSLKLFYIRRTIRIFPLYYLVILVLYLLNEPNLRENIFWLITYQSNNYIAFTGHWMGSFDHFWSLAVEEQFYIFFPFLIFFLNNKHLPKTLLALVLLSVILRFWLYFNHTSWVVPFVLMPTSLDALGLGSLLAYYFHIKKGEEILSICKIKIGLLVSFLAYCSILFLIRNQPVSHDFYTTVLLRLFEALFSVFLIFSFVKINDKSAFTTIKKLLFENEAIVFIGKISYGIYIYHHFIYNIYYSTDGNFIVKIFKKLNYFSAGLGDNIFVQLGILFPIVLIISTISWYILEKPINNLKEQFKYWGFIFGLGLVLFLKLILL